MFNECSISKQIMSSSFSWMDNHLTLKSTWQFIISIFTQNYRYFNPKHF